MKLFRNIAGSLGLLAVLTPGLARAQANVGSQQSFHHLTESGTTLTVDSNATLSVAGTLSVSGTQTYSGAATFSSTLTANGNVTLGNAATDTTAITGSTSITLAPAAATGGTALAVTDTVPVETTGTNTHKGVGVTQAIGAATGGTNTVNAFSVTQTGGAYGTAGTNVNAGLNITQTTGIWAAGATNSMYGVLVSPTISNATGGTNTYAAFQAANITGDAEITEYGAYIGTGYDTGLYVASPITLTGSTNTVDTNDTLAVTTADKLTVGGVIVPQVIEISDTTVLVGSSLDHIIFVANAAYQVTACAEVHGTKEAAGTVTISLERLQGTEAVGSGDALLTNNANAGFDGTAAIDTVQTGTLTGTTTNLQLAVGDRLALNYAGDVPGELAGVCVTVTLKRI